jgi:hypothetical protein
VKGSKHTAGSGLEGVPVIQVDIQKAITNPSMTAIWNYLAKRRTFSRTGEWQVLIVLNNLIKNRTCLAD